MRQLTCLFVFGAASVALSAVVVSDSAASQTNGKPEEACSDILAKGPGAGDPFDNVSLI